MRENMNQRVFKSIVFTRRCCYQKVPTTHAMSGTSRGCGTTTAQDFSKRAVIFVAKSGQHDHDRSVANRGTQAVCSVLFLCFDLGSTKSKLRERFPPARVKPELSSTKTLDITWFITNSFAPKTSRTNFHAPLERFELNRSHLSTRAPLPRPRPRRWKPRRAMHSWNCVATSTGQNQRSGEMSWFGMSCVHVYIYVRIYIYIFIYLWYGMVCLHVCMYACMHVCMYACIYIYICV